MNFLLTKTLCVWDVYKKKSNVWDLTSKWREVEPSKLHEYRSFSLEWRRRNFSHEVVRVFFNFKGGNKFEQSFRGVSGDIDFYVILKKFRGTLSQNVKKSTCILVEYSTAYFDHFESLTPTDEVLKERLYLDGIRNEFINRTNKMEK